jgi:hypothetical protein
VSTTDSTLCMCPLKDAPEYEGHTEAEHRDEQCTGGWTFDPPCGGCINCRAAQALYYGRGGEG